MKDVAAATAVGSVEKVTAEPLAISVPGGRTAPSSSSWPRVGTVTIMIVPVEDFRVTFAGRPAW
eukprot:245717-Prymnesium_polylepis.1